MSESFFKFFDSDRPAVDPQSPEWKTISFKEYPRSPQVLFSKPSPIKISLQEALLRRETERDFSKKQIDKKTLGDLLFWSTGPIHGTSRKPKEKLRRSYPSGGARYPVEVYAAVFNAKDIENGIYHYNLRDHYLEKLFWASTKNIKEALPYDFAKKAAALIMFSFVGERALKKYGSLGYKLGLLEGGHIGQNVYLVGTALGLGVLALGGMDYSMVQKELDLGSDETIFYQLVVGWPR